MLLVAAAVAGEPISLASGATQVAGGIGNGLNGMTDPGSVSASGRLAEDDRIGAEIIENADDVDQLLKLGQRTPAGNLGIPGTMMEAYQRAAETLATTQPNCHLHWSLLASIGRIESNHARGGRLDDKGNTVPNILGPVLNGGGFAAIADTDGGAYDGDARWDRAVGAMQFIPSTWEGYSSDGNGDGVESPHNVYDETLAAGKYLCSGGMDMAKPADRATAVFRYNHSDSYVATVLTWAEAYAKGVTMLPSDPVLPDAGNLALGPPSVGSQLPKQTPSTNKPKPKPSTSTTTKPTSTTTTTTTRTSSSTTTTTTTTTTTSSTTTTTTTTTTCPAPSEPPATTEPAPDPSTCETETTTTTVPTESSAPDVSSTEELAPSSAG